MSEDHSSESPGLSGRSEHSGEIVVISSVVPKPTTGGEIVLYRHLTGLDGWTVRVVGAPRAEGELSTWERLITRLQRTRLHRFVADLEVYLDISGFSLPGLSLRRSSGRHRTVVVTVAHGEGARAARRFARANRLPLVTFFHDWWPDISSAHAPFHRMLDNRFRRLYDDSAAALCVSERMRELLGNHRHWLVLPPIPGAIAGGKPGAGPAGKQPETFGRVLYFGNLHDYGHEVGQLLQQVKEHPTLRVQCRGRATSWSGEFRDKMRAAGLWLDYAPRAEFEAWLQSADIYLIVMSFDANMRRRMETSFPSKLTEVVQFGKPLMIWGPEYCSAVRWARAGGRAMCVTESSPLAVVSALERLAEDAKLRAEYAAASRAAAVGEFCPERLQQQFASVIDAVSSST